MNSIASWIVGLTESPLQGIKGGCFDLEDERLTEASPKGLQGSCFNYDSDEQLFPMKRTDQFEEESKTLHSDFLGILFGTPFPRKLSALPALPNSHPSTGNMASISAVCQTRNLQIGQQSFDPNHPTMKAMLLAQLGAGPHSTIERLSSNHGGLNEGVWTVKDPAQPSQNLVLKLVSARRGEGETFARLAREQPGICSDPLLTFPKMIFSCIGASGEKRYDLVAMRTAPGISVAAFIAQKHFLKQTADIMRVLTKIGSCLRKFHSRYDNAQHADFQISNIFYDEATDSITFIDFAGMGAKARCKHADVDFFVKSLQICAMSYGSQIFIEGARHFEAAYRTQGA